MRAPLSVVIPTLNAAEGLGPCLAALAEGLEAGLVRELVISDGGSGDGTLALAEEAGAVVVSGLKGRGGQLARGAAVAGGAWLLFLHADTRLAPGWAGLVQRHMAESAGFAAAFRLRFDVAGGGARFVAGWANQRSRVFGLPYGDQGLLISRALYEEVGGYPDISLMEDVALARRLKGRIRLLAGEAVTSGGKFQREGWFLRGGRNLWRLVRFLAGADPEGLARRY